MARGACRQADPELFFPISTAGAGVWQAQAAKTVCGGCAVSVSCLAYALEAMPEGIWGGTTLDERRAARRSSARRAGHTARQRVTPGGTT
jgi:WhiB family transcriptional regulator, redox-sensing transcriptional regulator